MQRLIAFVIGFAPVFVILAISYETLFFFSFSMTLLLWLVFEIRLSRFNTSSSKSSTPQGFRSLRLDDLRLAVIFLFFVHVGFFGTGNIASISSFYLEPVYRLIPVFHPFSMSALLLLKILIPFFIVAAVINALNKQLQLPPFALFMLALSISDILSLNFFFLVTDNGSWLEIGQSISHFSIASLMILFMAALYLVGERTMQGTSPASIPAFNLYYTLHVLPIIDNQVFLCSCHQLF